MENKVSEKKTGANAPKPKRSIAPQGVTIGMPIAGQRTDIIEKLNEADPEYVYMYQEPKFVGKDAQSYKHELKMKAQEVVTDSNGDFLHHMGDPIVKAPRKLMKEARVRESEFSREQVEVVVKSTRSTVKRRKKVID